VEILISPTTGGLMMLKEMLQSLPNSEKKIAAYIIENPEISVISTTSELGERTQTSGAAVIRLCKSLGLKGFQDLKIRIAGDIHRPAEEGYRDIQPNESQSTVLYKMTNNSIQALRETVEIINQDELEKAVHALIHARQIHFFGVGASSIIAQDAQHKFLRINKQATAFSDIHIAAMHVANMSEEDIVMGISFSGETLEVAKVVDLANQKGAKTISMTRYGSSTIAEKANINLYTSASKEAIFRSGATSSRLAQLHMIDILFMCVATQQYEETVHYLDQTREAVDSLREKPLRKKGDS
jgi:DNA-binding MurR/RpiR family transcriptional regulator